VEVSHGRGRLAGARRPGSDAAAGATGRAARPTSSARESRGVSRAGNGRRRWRPNAASRRSDSLYLLQAAEADLAGRGSAGGHRAGGAPAATSWASARTTCEHIAPARFHVRGTASVAIGLD
jgi:hypothetical protein